MQDKLFMNAEEVANILGVSKAHAYKLIQRLNGEFTKIFAKCLSTRYIHKKIEFTTLIK